MKPLIVFSVLLLLSFKVFAQQSDRMLYLQKAEKYRRMKNTGCALTIIGGGVWILGVVTLSNYTEDTTYNGYTTTTTSSGNLGEGVAEVLVGTAALGAGIPLWIVGGHNKKKYERRLQTTISLKPYTTPKQQGLTLCYRF